MSILDTNSKPSLELSHPYRRGSSKPEMQFPSFKRDKFVYDSKVKIQTEAF